jgi:hypothetical protein
MLQLALKPVKIYNRKFFFNVLINKYYQEITLKL